MLKSRFVWGNCLKFLFSVQRNKRETFPGASFHLSQFFPTLILVPKKLFPPSMTWDVLGIGAVWINTAQSCVEMNRKDPASFWRESSWNRSRRALGPITDPEPSQMHFWNSALKIILMQKARLLPGTFDGSESTRARNHIPATRVRKSSSIHPDWTVVGKKPCMWESFQKNRQPKHPRKKNPPQKTAYTGRCMWGGFLFLNGLFIFKRPIKEI